jgi:hypothetical protein
MFIISLAIADITVALLVMPFSLLFEVYGQWRFGWVFCSFWISCDVMCCTASILHLCVISLDRYLAITQPLTYKWRMSRRRASGMIASVWACSVAISFVPIFRGWYADTDHVQLFIDTPECGLDKVNKVYAVISALLSFYIPLIIMVFAYVKIFCIAQHQAMEIQKLECSLYTHNSSTHSRTDRSIKKKSKRQTRDAKAIKTLGILMGLFIFCWLPFFLMYIIGPFCPQCVFPPIAISIITWLGYVNSFFNPCVYAFLNRNFRMAFSKILSCGNTYHWWWCGRKRSRHHRDNNGWDYRDTNAKDNSSIMCEEMVENGHYQGNHNSTSMAHHGMKIMDIPLER